MKNLYSLLFLLFSLNGFTQSYLPIPESNAVWIEGSFLYYAGHEHTTITQPLSFGNDSIVSGTTYHTLHGHAVADWVDGWGNQQTYQSGTDYYIDQVRVLFRQDLATKRVYQWDNNSNQEQILYDFDNMVVGQPYPQTLNNANYPQILVMAYDSIMLMDGLYHERWTLGSNSLDSGFVAIIEGVGSTMGFDLPISIPFEQSSATLCLAIDGVPLYDGWSNANGLIPPRYSEFCTADVSVQEINEEDAKVSLFPNPVDDLLTIYCESPIEKIEVFTLLGQGVFSQEVSQVQNTTINLGSLPEGNYLVKIFSGDRHFVTKRIVK